MKRPPVIVVQIIHILGPMKGEIQEFTEPVISVGRHSSCQVRFPADLIKVSRKHAEIIREGNQFKLIDQSTNGTFVNGKKVKEAFLKNGDVLAFSDGGPKVSFLTQIKEGEGEVERSTPSTPVEPKIPFTPQPPISPREIKKPETKWRGRIEPPPERPAPEKPDEVPIQSVKAPLAIQYGPTLRSFKDLPVTLGKHPKCDFPLDHPRIVDYHAQIFFSRDQYWIKDLTGQKLVQVNGQPISLQAPLGANDELALSPGGPFFRFLGGGRLAEVTEPSIEKPKEEEASHVSEEKEPKKGPSVFKKFFRH